MANPTLNWTLNLDRGTVGFGRLLPFAGNTYALSFDGGSEGDVYIAYVVSGDTRECLAKSSYDGSGYTIAFDTEALWHEFTRSPHEVRNFHCVVRNGTYASGSVIEGSTVAESDIPIMWNPLWTEATTGAAYSMRGPKGDDGDDGNGIASISANGQDAQGNNVYLITMTDGTTYTFKAPKGSKGDAGVSTWDAISGKPEEFTPSDHQHVTGDITGLQAAIDSAVAEEAAAREAADADALETASEALSTASSAASTASSAASTATMAMNAASTAAAGLSTEETERTNADTALQAAIRGEVERAQAAERALQPIIEKYLKDAVVNGGVLTLTKKDGTTVTFKGGSSAWADITDKPQSFTPSAHSHDYLPLVADKDGVKNSVTVGTSATVARGVYTLVNGEGCGSVGNFSHSEGERTNSAGKYSHSEGTSTNANGVGSHAEGSGTFAQADYSHTDGVRAYAKDKFSRVFNGVESRGLYKSHGEGTFNVNPKPQGEGETDPASGFYVGETSLKEMIGAKANTDQLPYSSTSTPADRTCATVTVASTGASVAIPKPSTESKITAFAVYLDMTALTGTAPSIGFKYPLGEGETEAQDADILTRGGEGLSYETGAVNAVFFIQCGTKYIASAQVYK